MGSEADREANSTTPTLPLFSLPCMKSPEHSGSFLISPLHTSASVPFRWEEQPGKPLPCLALALPSNHDTIKCLDLPPRLLNESRFTKTPSPTTVLEGPYNSVGKSSSFRFFRKRQGGSFDGAFSPERGLLGTVVLSCSSRKEKRLFGSWRKRGGLNFKSKSETHGGNFVFPSFSDDGTGSCNGVATVKVRRVSGKESLFSLSPPKFHCWATIYGAFKQVIPGRSMKWKKDAL